MIMKKQDRSKDLVSDYLKSVEGMEEATTDPFFYSRLKARMQHQQAPVVFFKPGWAVALLALLLVINSMLLFQQRSSEVQNDTGLKGFANEYNLTIQSPL